MASREDREAARDAARRRERETAIWNAAKRGSKVAKRMTIIQGGKKDKK